MGGAAASQVETEGASLPPEGGLEGLNVLATPPSLSTRLLKEAPLSDNLDPESDKGLKRVIRTLSAYVSDVGTTSQPPPGFLGLLGLLGFLGLDIWRP
eukprot:222979-Prorocentrum_minimum.AAC.1